MTAPEPIRDPHRYFGWLLIVAIPAGLIAFSVAVFAIVGTVAGWWTW